MKSSLKQKSGITLIALVITIVVLLILAGVTIATLTGESGEKIKVKVLATVRKGKVEKIQASNGETKDYVEEGVIFELDTNGEYTFTAITDKGKQKSTILDVNVSIVESSISMHANPTTASEDATADIAGILRYEYSKDGNTYQSSNTFSNCTVGEYTIYVKAIDKAGNEGIDTIAVTISNTGPKIESVSISSKTSSSLTISALARDNEGDALTYKLYMAQVTGSTPTYSLKTSYCSSAYTCNSGSRSYCNNYSQCSGGTSKQCFGRMDVMEAYCPNKDCEDYGLACSLGYANNNPGRATCLL